MLLVDPRVGSKDLLEPLRNAGVPAESQHLDFGDFAFIGRGIHNADIYIGVELKRFGTDEGRSDLLQSMSSTRFAGHQLIGLQGFDRAWLLTEGIHRASPDGVLEILVHREWKRPTIRKRFVMLADLHAWLLTQTIRGGIAHWHAQTRTDSVRFLSSLYRWWTDKALDEHRSHQAIYLPPPDRAMVFEPSTFTKIASCLPGVGWDRALALDTHYNGSIPALVSSTVQELQSIPGIGKKTAESILAALGVPAGGFPQRSQ